MPNWVHNTIEVRGLDKRVLKELYVKVKIADESEMPWLDPFGFVMDYDLKEEWISVYTRTAWNPPTEELQIFSQQYKCLVDIVYSEPLSDERGRLIFEKGALKGERYGKTWNDEVGEDQDFIYQDWFDQVKWTVDMFLGKTNVVHLRRSE